MIIGNTKNSQEKCPAQCVPTNRDVEKDKNLLPAKMKMWGGNYYYHDTMTIKIAWLHI